MSHILMLSYIKYVDLIMMMIIFIQKKDTLQIMMTDKQQSPYLRMPVESYKKLIWH